MKCISCGAKTASSTTTDVTELGECLVIIRNVPCIKCSECDEIIYTADVVKRLESITSAAKTAMNEIAIIDYNSKVA
ncbi:MAG: type II toxin-antitoxin system MqsA family antitoxin [Oscillospiraceae bacterium]|nr:type II toxin-antitoxin system MqsA family antitoxin [Oscillospiraceae bacterium]